MRASAVALIQAGGSTRTPAGRVNRSGRCTPSGAYSCCPVTRLWRGEGCRRRLQGASEAGLQLRDARIALGDCLLDLGPGRSMGSGFLVEPGPRLAEPRLGLVEPGLGFVEPRLRRPAGRNLLLHPFAHLLVGLEVLPALRVVKPQSAVFVVPHLEPERFAVQAEPAVDQGDGRQRAGTRLRAGATPEDAERASPPVESNSQYSLEAREKLRRHYRETWVRTRVDYFNTELK